MIKKRNSLGQIISIPLGERFWDKVKIGTDCWEWIGCKFRNGYGLIMDNRRSLLAHRVSWNLHFGDTEGLFVLHRCDNPSCVNPNHLFLGTQLDNIRDMDFKRRRVNSPQKGNLNGSSKLTEEQVMEIRNLRIKHKIKCKQIAEMFKVSVPLVQKIIAGKLWKSKKAGYVILGAGKNIAHRVPTNPIPDQVGDVAWKDAHGL